MSVDRSRVEAPTADLWSKHRVEALTDGIFAVAMTLLVIDLKVPDPHDLRTQQELGRALADQAPKMLAWVISFFVLATFWIAHHRLFHYLRHVDRPLLWRNINQLAFVALMPFSAALIGEYPGTAIAQVAYNGNMILLCLLGIWKVRYVRAHPVLSNHPLEARTYHAALLRLGGLAACGVVAIALGFLVKSEFATLIYLAMIAIGRAARRIERKTPVQTAARVGSESNSNDHS